MYRKLIDEALPGRSIEFKRHEGARGRKALGKAISRNPLGLTVEAANGELEIVREHLLHRVIKRRGRPAAIDPYLLARAKDFEKSVLEPA